MNGEIVTKEDLQLFRIQLLDDLKHLLGAKNVKEDLSQWLKSKDVRKILNACPSTLQNLRISGKLHPVKIAGTWYYSKDEVTNLFNA